MQAMLRTPICCSPATPEAVRCITSLNYNTNNTGAGIKAALWAGADMDGGR